MRENETPKLYVIQCGGYEDLYVLAEGFDHAVGQWERWLCEDDDTEDGRRTVFPRPDSVTLCGGEFYMDSAVPYFAPGG